MQKIKKIWKMAVLITAVLLLVSVEGCKNVAEDSGVSTSVAPQGGGGSTTVNITFEAGYYIAYSSSTWSAMTNVTLPQAGQRTAGAAVIETMAKAGYTFRGWVVKSSYNPNAASYNQQNIITTYPSTASTLVGIWQENAPNTYSLSYSWGDGVTGVSSAVPTAKNNIVSGTSVTVEIPNVTRAGYRFLGWSRTANASTAEYTSSNKQITIAQNTMLYAVWEIIPYSITWNLDGGSISSGRKDTYTVEDSDYDLPTPTKAGRKFLGWYTTSNFTENSKVTKILKGSAENKTFYAKWIRAIKMISVTGGKFNMGEEYGSQYPFPGTEVTVSSFRMSETEITQAQWKDVVGNDGYGLPGDGGNGDPVKPVDYRGKGDDYPMYYVSWHDAIVFCNKLSIKEGKTPCYKKGGETDTDKWGRPPRSTDTSSWNDIICDFDADGYRLPTSTEWEYAARGGSSNTYKTFSGTTGNTENDLKEVAWYREDLYGKSNSHEVDTKPNNANPIKDMTGNVSEWCWDKNINGRMLRGGSMLDDYYYYDGEVFSYLTVWYSSGGSYPSYRFSNVGFRIVCRP